MPLGTRLWCAALYVAEHALVCNTSRGDEAGYVLARGDERTGASSRRLAWQYELVRVSGERCGALVWPELGGATVVTIGGARLGGASYESLGCRFVASAVGGVRIPSALASTFASVHGSDGVRCVSPSGLPTGWATRRAVELRRDASQRRELLRARRHAGERAGAPRRPGVWRDARGRVGLVVRRRVDAALPLRVELARRWRRVR